jgi:hypothetical protein
MCYNCGCGEPEDDHGKGHMGVDPDGKAITSKTFAEAAKGFKQEVEEAKRFTHDQLMKETEDDG